MLHCILPLAQIALILEHSQQQYLNTPCHCKTFGVNNSLLIVESLLVLDREKAAITQLQKYRIAEVK